MNIKGGPTQLYPYDPIYQLFQIILNRMLKTNKKKDHKKIKIQGNCDFGSQLPCLFSQRGWFWEAKAEESKLRALQQREHLRPGHHNSNRKFYVSLLTRCDHHQFNLLLQNSK